MDLYLKNGLIVTPSTQLKGGVLIKDGLIAGIVAGNSHVDARQTIDLQGKVVMPGVIDSHVHFQEPGHSDWETYQKATRAAAAGGVTTIMDMPIDSMPPTVDLENLRLKRDWVSKEALIDCAQWGGLVENNLDQLERLSAAGVIGWKAFMVDTGIDDYKRVDDDLLYAGLLLSKQLGTVVGVHAENEWVVSYLTDKLQRAKRVDRKAWLESHPPETELEAIRRAVFWAQVTGGNLHVLHTTIAAGVETVTAAKQSGVRVTVETCPHYLCFDEEDFLRLGPILKTDPPLRSRQEVEDLWACVLSGKVDVIASDHSPSTWREKERGMDDIWKAWGGIGGVQTMLPFMLTAGVHQRGLSLSSLVRMLSENPARIYGVYPRKGALLPGADADLVIIDLEKQWTLQADQIQYQNPQSPFIGYSFMGLVERTILRGVIVYENGRFPVQAGYGQVLKRTSFQ